MVVKKGNKGKRKKKPVYLKRTVVHIGPRGAPYIISCRKGKKKIYLNVSEAAQKRNEELCSRRDANRRD